MRGFQQSIAHLDGSQHAGADASLVGDGAHDVGWADARVTAAQTKSRTMRPSPCSLRRGLCVTGPGG
jgi:hypothetical protein